MGTQLAVSPSARTVGASGRFLFLWIHDGVAQALSSSFRPVTLAYVYSGLHLDDFIQNSSQGQQEVFLYGLGK